MGLLHDPVNVFCVDTIIFKNPLNSESLAQKIDDFLHKFGLKREYFVMLLSDAAHYVVKTGKILKSLYPNLIHVTCIAHLYHNVAEKIRKFCPDVDFMIASMKALVNKNYKNKELFKSIGPIPDPVITRWGTWLKAVQFYCCKLNKVREIFLKVDTKGYIYENAKNALGQSSLQFSLYEISENYKFVVDLIEKTSSGFYSIKQSLEDSKLFFSAKDKDPVEIVKYFETRFAKFQTYFKGLTKMI